MEDGVKGNTVKPKEAKFMGKAGWVKKSSGKFLASYKDRYIQVENTEIVVYENEDLKNCLERVDLENYDKCHELRSAFKKKNRLVVIRAQKCGNKIQDVKIQAQNPEEKDAWIKALSDGINRAKNKIFDEVKVDESCSLEHVTRTRPKGNQGRRPPTRIHMKEVANLSSDGILRKDLDAFENTPNGTHQVNTEVDASKEAVKPPMPPTKMSESPQELLEAEPTPQKKVLKPPMPPSKENKPSSQGQGQSLKEVEPAPPMPSNKASPAESDSREKNPFPSSPPPGDPIHPPMPPSKDKKPTQTVQWEIPLLSHDPKDGEEESPEETFSDNQGKNDSDEFGNEGNSTPPPLKKAIIPLESKLGSTVPEEADEASAEKEGSSPILMAPEKEEPVHSNVAVEAVGNSVHDITSTADDQKPAALLTKSAEPSPQPVKKPPAPPKKIPLNCSEGDQTCDLKEGSAEVPIPEESRGASLTNESVPIAVISYLSQHKDDLTPTVEHKMTAQCTGDTADVTVFPDHSVQQRKQEESSDSGQHPDYEPPGGDGSAADAEPAKGHVPQKGKVATGARTRVQILPQVQPARFALPLKPLKGKSASMGDLLSESTVQRSECAVEEFSRTSQRNDTNELHNKVAVELEDTVKLLDTLSSEREVQGSLGALGGPKSLSPEELLTKAVEKLRKADQFLRVAKSLKQADPLEKKHRMSW